MQKTASIAIQVIESLGFTTGDRTMTMPQMLLLLKLFDRKELSQASLEDELHVSKTAVSRTLYMLGEGQRIKRDGVVIGRTQGLGWVLHVEDDGRSKVASLTRVGHAHLQQIMNSVS